MTLVEGATRRFGQQQAEGHQICQLPMISVSRGEEAELIHDPDHAPVGRLGILAVGHSGDLGLDEPSRDASRLPGLLQCSWEPSHQRCGRRQRHHDRIESLLVDQQGYLWSPEEPGAIPIPKESRRVGNRGHHGHFHPVEQLLRCMQAEHHHQSRIEPPNANPRPTPSLEEPICTDRQGVGYSPQSKLNVMSEAPEVTMTSVEDAAALWLKDRLVEYRELLAYLRDR